MKPPIEHVGVTTADQTICLAQRTVTAIVILFLVRRKVFFSMTCGVVGLLFSIVSPAQELQPRAYFPAPVGVNFLGMSYSHNSGGLLFDPSLPVEDAQVTAHIAALSFGGSLGVFGRSGQALAVLPYVIADISGKA